MMFSPNAMMKAKAKSVLRGNLQVALLVCFVASLPNILGQVLSIVTGGDAMTRLSEGMYALMVKMEAGYVPETFEELYAVLSASFDMPFLYASLGTQALGLLTPMLTLGMWHFLMELLRGKAGEVKDVLSRKGLFFKAIGLDLLISLKIALWALPGAALMIGASVGANLLLVNMSDISYETVMGVFTAITYVSYIAMLVSVIIALYRYGMAPYHLADAPETRLRDCIAASKTMMKHRKIALFSLHFSFIGWSLLITLINSLLQSMFGYVIGQTVNMFLTLALTLYTETSNCCFYLLQKDPEQIGFRRVDPSSIPGFQKKDNEQN